MKLSALFLAGALALGFGGLVQAAEVAPAAPISVSSDVAVEHTQMSERRMMKRRMMHRRAMHRRHMMRHHRAMHHRAMHRRHMMRHRGM